MKKFDAPLVLDALFYAFCAFLLSVGVLRYYRAATWAVFTASALSALAVGGFSALLLYRSHRKRALGKQAQKRRDALMLHLTLASTKSVLSALAEAYRADGKTAEAGEDTLTVEGMTVVPLFTMQPVSADAIAVLLRRFEDTPFRIACNGMMEEARTLLASFGRTAEEGDGIFSLFERTGTTPSPLICGELPRYPIKARIRRTFSKKNARPFFVSGALLLLMSLFTLFPLYYLITGAMLLITAVCVRAFGCA